MVTGAPGHLHTNTQVGSLAATIKTRINLQVKYGFNTFRIRSSLRVFAYSIKFHIPASFLRCIKQIEGTDSHANSRRFGAMTQNLKTEVREA